MGQATIADERQATGGTRPPTETGIGTVRAGHPASLGPQSTPASPAKVVMAARWAVVVVVLVFVMAGTADAADGSSGQQADIESVAVDVDDSAEDATNSSTQEAFSAPKVTGGEIVPVIVKSMAGSVTEKLRPAFDLAVERVRDVPECGALFERLKCDGVDLLSKTLYLPAHPLNEESACRRGATAFTLVGASQTWVCRRFSALSLERAAMTLIHEALHHGGLTEAPLDPDAMNAREINGMVSRACGF